MIIFVGDKPSPRMKPGAKPFEGAACEKRLKEWIEALDLGLEVHVIINAHDSPPKSLFVDLSYEFCYLAMKRKEVNERVVWIALGNSAAEVCHDHGLNYFKLPHPSGRNRQINDKEFIAKKLSECREWLKSRQNSP